MLRPRYLDGLFSYVTFEGHKPGFTGGVRTSDVVHGLDRTANNFSVTAETGGGASFNPFSQDSLGTFYARGLDATDFKNMALTNSTLKNVNTPLGVSVWARADTWTSVSGADSGKWVCKWQHPNCNFALFWRTNGQVVWLLTQPAGSYHECASAAGVAQVGVWNHYLATYDGANMRLYVNGVIANTVAQTGAAVATATEVSMNGRPAGDIGTAGAVRHVAIWSARSAPLGGAEAADIFTNITLFQDVVAGMDMASALAPWKASGGGPTGPALDGGPIRIGGDGGGGGTNGGLEITTNTRFEGRRIGNVV